MKLYYIAAPLFLLTCACSNSWLEVKRDLNTVLPKDLADLEAILNSNTRETLAYDYAGQLLVSCDDYYVDNARLISSGEAATKLYKWDTMPYAEDDNRSEWNLSYMQVFYANVVLETLAKIKRDPSNALQWDNVKGGALFFRAKAFFNLSQQFSPPFDKESDAPLGIPLRLSSDPNIVSVRSTMVETYDRITEDLETATGLLSEWTGYPTQASRAAAYGLLSRVYLSKREYDTAGKYADSCLMIRSSLMDYNEIPSDNTANSPFLENNEEVVFNAQLMPLYGPPASSRGTVDSILFESYTESDLRKNLFYTATGGFKGDYTGSQFKFGGIAVDEMYLNRAECNARQGDTESAIIDMKYLLKHRYESGSQPDIEELTGEALLKMILDERRKELAFRGLRWTDLRRLNKEEGHRTTLVRILDGERYELLPEDPRYTFPIPPNVIKFTGMTQNHR